MDMVLVDPLYYICCNSAHKTSYLDNLTADSLKAMMSFCSETLLLLLTWLHILQCFQYEAWLRASAKEVKELDDGDESGDGR